MDESGKWKSERKSIGGLCVGSKEHECDARLLCLQNGRGLSLRTALGDDLLLETRKIRVNLRASHFAPWTSAFEFVKQ
ncbi:hypothetical protein SK128_027340 [Halocaridina rubra]|uniref:Uncharacterized protein n=1 Tax=Halocaridina rubra TaxID=373956 RepID=A0AAN8X9K9_HALRR